MRFIFHISFLVVLLMVSGLCKSWAQDQCELTLNEAQEEFNAGHFYAVPLILEECLKKNQNRAWRQRAYLLLAETHLLLENTTQARDSYLEVLWANPEYVTEKSRDPIDLVYLSSKFTATPIFSLHGKLGANTSPIRVIHDVKINGEGYTREKYYLTIGWQAGVGIDWHYNEKLTFCLEVNYAFSSFKHETTNLFGFNRDIIELIDRQTSLNVPLIIKYSDHLGKYRPYGYTGIAGNLLLSDRASLSLENRDLGIEEILPEQTLQSEQQESPTLSLIDKRNILNTSFLVGGGVKYKWGLNYLFVDLRYSFGLTNVVDPTKRYDDLAYQWPYVDDDFYIDNVAISVGYIHPLYKPRELKKAKSKSVLRKINRDNK